MTPSHTPTRMPSRRSLQPALAADVHALAAAGHLAAVTDGVYRRAHHPADTTPTARQTHDRHVNAIATAVLARATDAALDAHRAARTLLDRVGVCSTTDHHW